MIRVNTNCFYYWDWPLQKIVDRFGPLLDGFEFCLQLDKIKNFQGLNLPKNLKCNSMHLPYLHSNFNLFKELKEIIKQLDVKHVVIHPSFLKHFEYIPEDINFLIENMDARMKKYKELKDVFELISTKPNFGFNLDVCHLEEIEQGSTDKIIDEIKDKITAMHISVPSGPDIGVNSPHFLCYNSDFPLPKKLPINIPWTIEGVIPKDNEESLIKEIEFLRNFQKSI